MGRWISIVRTGTRAHSFGSLTSDSVNALCYIEGRRSISVVERGVILSNESDLFSIWETAYMRIYLFLEEVWMFIQGDRSRDASPGLKANSK